MIIGQIISVIFAIWMVLGIPLGVIFLVIMLSSKNKAKWSMWKKLAIISFCGIPAVLIINLVLSFAGINISQPLPTI